MERTDRDERGLATGSNDDPFSLFDSLFEG
jgi:hypothetical protein